MSERVAGSQHADDADEVARRRARFLWARRQGGICGACGRMLSADEPVWRVPLVVGPGYVTAQVSRLIPVGVECVPPELVRATEGQEFERCVGCGRGVYHPPSTRHRHRPFCCERCRLHGDKAAKAPGSEAR